MTAIIPEAAGRDALDRYCAPVFRWPGGKRKLVPQLLRAIGETDEYAEPFIGAGVVALNVRARTKWIGDLDWRLLDIWREIRDRPRELHAEILRLLPTDEESFYALRARELNHGTAAMMLAVLAGSFNGLYRRNSAGQMNAAWRHKRPFIAPVENFVAASRAISGAHIEEGSAGMMIERIWTRGAVIYCDPPYVGTQDYGNTGRWTMADLLALVEQLDDSRRRGIRVVLSHAANPELADALGSRGWTWEEIDVGRPISGSAASRKKVREIIAVGGAA